MGNSLYERNIFEKDADIDTIHYILIGIKNMSYYGDNSISRPQVLCYLEDMIKRQKYKYKKQLKSLNKKWRKENVLVAEVKELLKIEDISAARNVDIY